MFMFGANLTPVLTLILTITISLILTLPVDGLQVDTSAFGTIVDGWPAPKVTKYVNYNSHLNN